MMLPTKRSNPMSIRKLNVDQKVEFGIMNRLDPKIGYFFWQLGQAYIFRFPSSQVFTRPLHLGQLGRL